MASEKVTAMIEEVKSLSVLELAELVHALEDEFGVSAAAVAAPAAGGAAAAGAAVSELSGSAALVDVGADRAGAGAGAFVFEPVSQTQHARLREGDNDDRLADCKRICAGRKISPALPTAAGCGRGAGLLSGAENDG